MKYSFRRALAIMLSVLFITGNLGLTAFAENFTDSPEDAVLIDEKKLLRSSWKPFLNRCSRNQVFT